ncbi:MAG TPA: hypothetical protein VID47_11290 [Actinomycetota bacterium]|jgi:hypothetical protein
MRKRPSAAMVVALVALFVSLAGTAEASFLISKNSQVAPHVISGANGPAGDTHNVIAGSVGTDDMHAGAVTTGKLANGSVTGAKVADGTIGHADLVQGLPCAFTMKGGDLDLFANLACGKVEVKQPDAGTYCITLPYTPGGGAATPDSSLAGFPVAFLSVDPSTAQGFHCSTTANAVVTTYSGAGGDLTSETFHAIFYQGI